MQVVLADAAFRVHAHLPLTLVLVVRMGASSIPDSQLLMAFSGIGYALSLVRGRRGQVQFR